MLNHTIRSVKAEVNTSTIKYEMKWLIHSKHSTVQPLKFGNGWIIAFNPLSHMWLLFNRRIKVNTCKQKVAQGWWDARVETSVSMNQDWIDARYQNICFKCFINSIHARGMSLLIIVPCYRSLHRKQWAHYETLFVLWHAIISINPAVDFHYNPYQASN